MAGSRFIRWCGNLRIKCFIIGYMHLIATIIDIAVHLAIVAVVSNGFQCDVNEELIDRMEFPKWLEPTLLNINMGTHGYYPLPVLNFRRTNGFNYFRYTSTFYVYNLAMHEPPRCYPGMLHVSMTDVLDFMINIIWLQIVRSYVVAVHKKDPEPMRMFFVLSLVKFAFQLLFYNYQPEFRSIATTELYWLIKPFDIMLAAIFLVIIYKYIKELRREKAQRTTNQDQPPPYVECLITKQINPVREQKEEKNETEVTITEEKKIEVESPAGKV